MKKFLEDKNLDKKVSEKLLDDKFIKKIAITILVGTMSFLNLLMEFTTKSIGALLGGDKPSIFGMFNFSYMLYFFPIYLIVIGMISLYILSQLIREILELKFLSSKLEIHPLAIMLSIYIGAEIFGVIGILVGPIYCLVAKDILYG